MSKAADRAARRHVREKTTIDRLVKSLRRPVAPASGEAKESPTTSTGLSVEDQIRKEWGPENGGLPTFWRDPPAFLQTPPRLPGRARGR